MKKSRAGAMLTVALLSIMPIVAVHAGDAELGGSMASMRRQYAVAKQNDYTFLRTPAQVRAFVREDRLQPLQTNEHLVVNNVSFPYARPAVKLFVERLAEQYHQAVGERLVVTSLTRPLSRQPRNAHDLSVHPAGMAVDLRIPSGKGRVWLESALLQLEAGGMLDATRERRPPHYHVAVFPEKYTAHVERLLAREGESLSADVAEAPVPASLEPAVESDPVPEPALAVEPVVEADEASAAVPIVASLGVFGVALAGLVRRRVRRVRGEREERRARVRS